MATDLEHEDTVETAVFGAQNNLIVTGSRDALIQVRGRPRACQPHLHLQNERYDSLGIFGLQNTDTHTQTSTGKQVRSLGGHGGVFWDPTTDVGEFPKYSTKEIASC